MALFSSDSASRTGFVLSLVALAFFYGLAADHFGWFPSTLVDRAVRQARAVDLLEPPKYVDFRVYDREGVRAPAPDEVEPGLTLVTSSWRRDGELTPGMRLMDTEGRVVHRWWIDPGEIFTEAITDRRGIDNMDVHGSYLFRESGDVLANLEHGGTVRMDACGEVLWTLTEPTHHSIARDDDGTFWIPSHTPDPELETPDHPEGFPGFEEPFYQDLILRVSPDGAVLDSIHVPDVLHENGLTWYFVDESRTNDEDPTHLNDVEPLSDSLASEYPLFEAGDLVVSLRHLELVFVMDPETREVRWHAPGPFLQQHDPDYLGDGWIGVFDNHVDYTPRGSLLGGSRIVALKPGTDSTRVLFPTERSGPFYARHRGKWQLLENGNRLLVESPAGRVVEAAPDGRTVWEWLVEPYSEDEVPAVTDAVRLDLAREEVASWACPGTGTDGGGSREG